MSKTPRHTVANLVAKRMLMSGFQAKKFSRELAAYLLETGRIGELDSLLRDVVNDRAEAGVVEVTAVSAYPLRTDARREIERVMKGRWPEAKQIIISEQLDPSVIGGVRLELPHAQLDLTVRNRLNRFKQGVI